MMSARSPLSVMNDNILSDKMSDVSLKENTVSNMFHRTGWFIDLPVSWTVHRLSLSLPSRRGRAAAGSWPPGRLGRSSAKTRWAELSDFLLIEGGRMWRLNFNCGAKHSANQWVQYLTYLLCFCQNYIKIIVIQNKFIIICDPAHQGLVIQSCDIFQASDWLKLVMPL